METDSEVKRCRTIRRKRLAEGKGWRGREGSATNGSMNPNV
jgi:hypothetical protein